MQDVFSEHSVLKNKHVGKQDAQQAESPQAVDQTNPFACRQRYHLTTTIPTPIEAKLKETLTLAKAAVFFV
ncbi:hypothetical protein VQ056_23825 [Paenibacillus sp. JTLBN-2024]